MKFKLSEKHLIVKSFRRLVKEDEILMQHNLFPYYKIAKSFNDGSKRVAIVHATGTGKAFLAIRWLNNELNGGISYSKSLKHPPISIPAHPNAKILYLAPTHAVINQVREHLNSVGKNSLLEHIEFVTYAKLLSMLKRSNHEYSEEELKDVELSMLEQTRFNDFIKQFSHIVVDEFHHVDENKWGNAVQIALNNSNAKILGLTATPVRSTGTDVAQTVFNGNVVSTISLADAIEQGILPIPDYYTAVYSYEKMLTSLERKIQKIKDDRKRVECTQMVDEIKTEIVKSGGIKEELLRHLKKHPNGKFIVFSDDIAMSQKNRNEILDMLGALNIAAVYDINSSNPNAHEELAMFRRARGKGLKIAFAVDMISEGVHIDDLDGVIMLRSTDSFIVYQQQLGRALASGKDKAHPLILDFVNNISSTFEYQQQSNQITDFFRTIATRKTDDPTIQKLIMRLQKEDKILRQIRELDKMLSYYIVSIEEKLRILKLLVDKGVDLNKIYVHDTLKKYISLEEAGAEIDYNIGRWLDRAKNGVGGKGFIEGLRALGFRDKEKKRNNVDTKEKLRICKLLVDNDVDLNNIKHEDTLTKYLSLEKAGAEFDYPIGQWLHNAKQGKVVKEFIERLRTLGFRDKEKKRTKLTTQERLRICKLLVDNGVDLNKIKFKARLSDYILLEQACVEKDYNIGLALDNAKRGVGGKEFIEGLRALGFRVKEKKAFFVSSQEKLRIFKLLVNKGVDLNNIPQKYKLSKYILLEEAGVGDDYPVGRWLYDINRAYKNNKGNQELINGLIELGYKFDDPLSVD